MSEEFYNRNGNWQLEDYYPSKKAKNKIRLSTVKLVLPVPPFTHIETCVFGPNIGSCVLAEYKEIQDAREGHKKFLKVIDQLDNEDFVEAFMNLE